MHSDSSITTIYIYLSISMFILTSKATQQLMCETIIMCVSMRNNVEPGVSCIMRKIW